MTARGRFISLEGGEGVGKSTQVRALAAALALYLGVTHLYLEWPTFPWWYNVGVAGLAAPAVLLGGKMAGGFARRATPAFAT